MTHFNSHYLTNAFQNRDITDLIKKNLMPCHQESLFLIAIFMCHKKQWFVLPLLAFQQQLIHKSYSWRDPALAGRSCGCSKGQDVSLIELYVPLTHKVILISFLANNAESRRYLVIG